MIRIILLLPFLLTSGHSFQKYPYVFLLDIGNEELQQTNNEDIRITVTGSSVALRYPAIGEGNTITHLRVSGIDFGADLKATVVDGGPGYKYVVLVLAGNQNIPYEVLVSIKSMIDAESSNEEDYDESIPNSTNNLKTDESVKYSEVYPLKCIEESENKIPEHDHSEDYNVEQADQNFNKKIYEKNLLNHPMKPEVRHQYYSNSENADTQQVENIQPEPFYTVNNFIPLPPRFYPTPLMKSLPPQLFYPQYIPKFINRQDIGQRRDFSSSTNQYINELPKPQPILSGGFAKTIGDVQPVEVVDKNVYDRYQALSPHLPEDISVYSHETSQDVDEQRSWDAPKIPSRDDTVEINQMFNDEEVHNDSEKYSKDSNNNYYTSSNDGSAVAYR